MVLAFMRKNVYRLGVRGIRLFMSYMNEVVSAIYYREVLHDSSSLWNTPLAIYFSRKLAGINRSCGTIEREISDARA